MIFDIFLKKMKKEKIDNQCFKKKEKLFILCGASCSGKNTLLNYLKEKYNLSTIISHTTRPMRAGEKDGEDYFFIKKGKFISMVEKGEFIEYKRYIAKRFEDKKEVWFYGKSKKEFDSKKRRIMILDLEGIVNFQKFYGSKNVVVIYLKAEDSLREERAKARKDYEEDKWIKRKLFDKNMFSKDFEKNVADYIIYNNNDKDFLETQADKVMKAYNISKRVK